MIDIFILIIGLILLIKSADWLVNGASSLVVSMKVSPLVIGLTIVAFGTSFPELVVNVYASYTDRSGLVLGNIIGSNIANILLILGTAAIIYPLRVQSTTVWKEIPFSLLAVVVLAILVSDTSIGLGTLDSISRADGLILLSFFMIFMYYLISLARKGSSSDDVADELPMSKNLLLIGAGLVGLLIGGKWVVDGAVSLAQQIGMSERIIGLTVVAFGTSLPELVTSINAAIKKKADIAIGNVVGSNIFNIFWILALSGVIKTVPVPIAVKTDLGFLLVASIALFITLFIGRKFHLAKWEGVLFLGLYLSYIVYSVTFT